MSTKESEEKLPPFQELNQQINETRQRNFEGTLEQANQELRDAYMQYKELSERCTIDMTPKSNFQQETEKKVFYFQPETFLLEEPEIQKKYRQTLLDRVGQVPKPAEVELAGEVLHREMSEAVADRSSPPLCQQLLYQHFLRRQYTLQHQKYKLLQRWAHLNLTSSNMEMLSSDATFMYSKLEMNLESCIQRVSRLSKNDFYDSAVKGDRPSTKTKTQGMAYVEKSDIPPQSLIREDDIEVYLRSQCYRNKVTRQVNKFISRVKWLPQNKKNHVYEQSVKNFFALKERNIQKQKDVAEKIRENTEQHFTMNADLKRQVELVIENMYYSEYQQMFLTPLDQMQNQWRQNHDEVPTLVSDQQTLKIKISELAVILGLKGDVEKDQGFGFSYQCSIFFPAYFQRCVVRSQFSVYDAFADQSDPNEQLKRNLFSMAYIDSNLFQDVSTNKQAVPSDESLQQEFKKSDDVKVLRLKSAESWIDYCILQAEEPEWYQKQEAMLEHVQKDELMRGALNFLDVQDVATVNRVHEDLSQTHQQSAQRMLKERENWSKKIVVQTNDGDKHLRINLLSEQNSSVQSHQIQNFLLKSVQEENEPESQRKEQQSIYSGQLFNLPSHLLTTYYLLRYSASKDAKTRILYCLNYFRSVQKQLALDLREFGTRDKIDGQQEQPYQYSNESNQKVLDNLQQASKKNLITIEKRLDNNQQKMLCFEFQQQDEIKDMASLRYYKQNGLFNNRVFSTCPSYPRVHISQAEPVVKESEEDCQQNSFQQNTVKLIGRQDFAEFNEQKREVYIKDDLGIYILYECALQDMQILESQLLKLGSFYLQKQEELKSPSSRPEQARDRQELVFDLLIKESEFQYLKAKVVQQYLECYEHISDPLEQQKLMQTITNLMALRPRVDLTANYFNDAYQAEFECLNNHFKLVQKLVSMQIRLEKSENSRLQDMLTLSFEMSHLYAKAKWKYQDSNAIFNHIEQKRAKKLAKDKETRKTKKLLEQPKVDSVHSIDSSQIKTKEQESKQTTKTVKTSEKTPKTQKETDDDYLQAPDENEFTNLLGLPSVNIESLYQQYRENDQTIIKIMKETTNFQHCFEGYPDFLTVLTHRQILQRNRVWKAAPWSQESGALDFYQSLDFINNLSSCLTQGKQELDQSLKMWNTQLLTHTESVFYQLCLEEFHHLFLCQEGSEQEYESREFFEDDQVLGSADKCCFLAKEMVAQLTTQPKDIVDPFVVAKLDLSSINFHPFPIIHKQKNKYTLQQQGVNEVQLALQYEKEQVFALAKNQVEVEEERKNQGMGVTAGMTAEQFKEMQERRNLQVPTLLQLYCNMVELIRIRQEIMMAASECAILTKTYTNQCDLISEKNKNVLSSESINFIIEDANLEMSACVNFVEDGPAHYLKFGLAISEFDGKLLSNCNFRNPDSLKLNILDSGLEELRAVLYYQIMQKQLLIVATRTNTSLLDFYERAITELTLIEKNKIVLPNSVVQLQKIFTPGQQQLPIQQIRNMAKSYKSQAGQSCAAAFYNVIQRKGGMKSTIAKDFGLYLAQVQQKQGISTQEVERVMRCFRVKLCQQFVTKVLMECHLSSQKYQIMQACHTLRHYNRFFNFDSKELKLLTEPQTIFQFETNSLEEMCSSNYQQSEENDNFQQKEQKEEVKVLTTGSAEIHNFFAIPSSSSIAQLDALQLEDTRKMIEQRKSSRKDSCEGLDDLKNHSCSDRYPEQKIKMLIPSFTPAKDNCNKYYEQLQLSETKIAKVAQFYLKLVQILNIEWFMIQLSLSTTDSILFVQALETGMPFFTDDPFTKRTKSHLPKPTLNQNTNPLSQAFLSQMLLTHQSKRNIADQVQTFGIQIKNLLTQYKKTKDEKKSIYLQKYLEFRYQQVIGSFWQLMQRFYRDGNIKAVQSLQRAIKEVTKVDHIKLVHLKPSNYTVRNCLVAPSEQQLGSLGGQSYRQNLNFARAIQPILASKQLEPAQIALFKSLYQYDIQRQHTVQFAGQLQTTGCKLALALLDMTDEDRQYSQSFIGSAKYQANDFMETVYNDTSLQSLTKEDVYDLHQLELAQRFINENTQAVLLRTALICWFENSTLPQTKEEFERFESNFRQNFFWKQLQQKDFISKKISSIQQFGKIPTKQELHQLKLKIDALQSDQTIATSEEQEKRDRTVEALRNEFNSLKKKVTLDTYYNTRAEIQVFSNEIEKQMIQASALCLDSESAALQKCFLTSVPTIQYHLHPFQCFAATLFDQVDPNANIELTNRVNAVQELITRMRNRSTEVETLTGGPGIVITIKDLCECMIEFSKTAIIDQQKQFRSRQESFSMKTQELLDKLYFKDRTITNLKHRLSNVQANLQNVINARLFEKGNQLIYELDSSNRILSLFRYNYFELEQKLTKKIQQEQFEKFKRKSDLVQLKTRNFEEYKQTIMNMIEADFAQNQDLIRIQLKEKAEAAKSTLYPYQINLYKPSISCEQQWQPNPKYPWPTEDLAQHDQLSYQEARDEVYRLNNCLRKQRIFFRTKEMTLTSKYERKLAQIQSDLNSNKVLWDQLAEARKREDTMKQELLFTQQNLSDSHKVIENLRIEIKSLDSEKNRLQKFKNEKSNMFKELEGIAKKASFNQNINQDTLIGIMNAQQEKIDELLTTTKQAENFANYHQSQKEKFVNDLKRQVAVEQQATGKVVEKMEQLKSELKIMEKNDTSVTSIWKKKCLDLFEVCQSLKRENEELRDRCKEMVQSATLLNETLIQTQQEMQRHAEKLQLENKGSMLNKSISSFNDNSVIGILPNSVRQAKLPVRRQTSKINMDAIQLNSQNQSNRDTEQITKNNSPNDKEYYRPVTRESSTRLPFQPSKPTQKESVIFLPQIQQEPPQQQLSSPLNQQLQEFKRTVGEQRIASASGVNEILTEETNVLSVAQSGNLSHANQFSPQPSRFTKSNHNLATTKSLSRLQSTSPNNFQLSRKSVHDIRGILNAQVASSGQLQNINQVASVMYQKQLSRTQQMKRKSMLLQSAQEIRQLQNLQQLQINATPMYKQMAELEKLKSVNRFAHRNPQLESVKIPVEGIESSVVDETLRN